MGPSGPGPLPEHSECLHAHQPHRHVPASQKRLCPPSAPMVEKARLQSPQRNWPSSVFSGMLVWPARKREPHALQSVFAPDGPIALDGVSLSLHSHHSHRQVPPEQKRVWPERAYAGVGAGE